MPLESWPKFGDKPQQVWETWDNISSEMEMGDLLYGLIRMLKPELTCETGCYMGYSTLRMAEAVCKNGFGKLISIDLDYTCAWNTRDRTKHIHPDFLEVRHGDVADKLPEIEQADFIFSDSSYEMRKVEMKRAKPGAVVVVHDTRLQKTLEGSVKEHGGLEFPAGRGFGIFIK